MKLVRLFAISVMSLILLQSTTNAMECTVRIEAMSPNVIIARNVAGYSCNTFNKGESRQFDFKQDNVELLMAVVLSAMSMNKKVYIHTTDGSNDTEVDDIAIIAN